jgi:hypothetical protein
MSFNDGFQADHRTLFADINHEFFAHHPSPLVASPSRLLRSGNPEDTAQYLTALRTGFEQHRPLRPVTGLSQTSYRPLRPVTGLSQTSYRTPILSDTQCN